MQIGGAKFDVGVMRDEGNCDEYAAFALKILIFGLDSKAAADLIRKTISKVLCDIDPNLEIVDLRDAGSSVN